MKVGMSGAGRRLGFATVSGTRVLRLGNGDIMDVLGGPLQCLPFSKAGNGPR
jgi:hypothetical protein